VEVDDVVADWLLEVYAGQVKAEWVVVGRGEGEVGHGGEVGR